MTRPCDCPACAPAREPWSERWLAIVPITLVAACVIYLTWNGSLFG